MRAMPLDQAVTPRLVAKQHQILAEQFDRPHRPRAGKLVHQRRRLPVHPHQFSAWRLSPGAGDQVVLLLAHHGGVSFGTDGAATLYKAGGCGNPNCASPGVDLVARWSESEIREKRRSPRITLRSSGLLAFVARRRLK